MLKAESESMRPRPRSGPSLTRTLQALRAIRHREVRVEPEMRIIAMRGSRRLA